MTSDLSVALPNVAMTLPTTAARHARAAEAHVTTADTILQLRHLSKVFGPKPAEAVQMMKQGHGRNEIFETTGHMLAVEDVSLDVRAGEIFVIMGLSGSGKSTLVRLLNRLIEPTSGSVVLEGRDIAPMTTPELREVRRKKMAMVFQSFALLPNRTVLDNIAYGLEVAGLPKSERYATARTALERVGLGSYEKLYPHELSGGMQQRVGLARALAVNPSVLLMDEAFSALDPLIRSEMQNELLRLQKQEQRTIVFISHDIEEALKIGGRIGIMKDGRLIQVGTPTELIHSPADDYVRDFFRHVDVSRFLTASMLMNRADEGVFRCAPDASAGRYLDDMIDRNLDCAYLCDENGRFLGCVTLDRLHKGADRPVRDALHPDLHAVSIDADLHELADVALAREYDVPVVDHDGVLAGVVSCRNILKQVLARRSA